MAEAQETTPLLLSRDEKWTRRALFGHVTAFFVFGVLVFASLEGISYLMANPAKCAVVFPSTDLIGKGQGPNIDAHKYVFRVNTHSDANVLKEHRIDTGLKTTHLITSVNEFRHDQVRNECLNHPRLQCVFAFSMYQLVSHFKVSRPTWYAAAMKQINNSSNTVRQMTNTEWAKQDAYFRGCLLRKNPHIVMATTGFKAVVIAKQMCDTVNIFGITMDHHNGHFQEFDDPDREHENPCHDYDVEHYCYTQMTEDTVYNDEKKVLTINN